MASDGIAFSKRRSLISWEHPILGQRSSEYARLEILQGSRSILGPSGHWKDARTSPFAQWYAVQAVRSELPVTRHGQGAETRRTPT